MQEYSSSKSDMNELYLIRKNYEKYIGKEMERWLFIFRLFFEADILNNIFLHFPIRQLFFYLSYQIF